MRCGGGWGYVAGMGELRNAYNFSVGKRLFKKYVMRVWTGFSWLNIGLIFRHF
jgi:hypothetical protein